MNMKKDISYVFIFTDVIIINSHFNNKILQYSVSETRTTQKPQKQNNIIQYSNNLFGYFTFNIRSIS